jgi:hypothetical protein
MDSVSLKESVSSDDPQKENKSRLVITNKTYFLVEHIEQSYWECEII